MGLALPPISEGGWANLWVRVSQGKATDLMGELAIIIAVAAAVVVDDVE
jgi:hypothetical protein